ncbi:MAG: DUF6709 family protein [Lachnospiraceae bacterium]
MIKKMWNRTYKKWVGIAVIALLIGSAILLLLSHEKTVTENRKFISLMDLNPMDAEGKYVEFIYQYVVGNISDAGEYVYDGQTYYSDGFPNRLNIILLDGAENHLDRTKKDRYFIVLEIGKDILEQSDAVEADSAAVNALLDKYDQGRLVTEEEVRAAMNNGIKIRGKVEPMDMAMSMRYESYFRELGYDYKEMGIYCLPYYIRVLKENTMPPVILYGLYILGFGLLIAAVIMLALAIAMPAQRNLVHRLTKIDPNEPERVESDFKRAKAFDADALLGEKYAYFIADSDVVKYEDILWMFPYVASQVDPFDRNKERIVKKDCIFICDDKGNPHKISIRTMESGKTLLDSIARHCPGVKIGYSDETKRLYEFHLPELIAERDKVKQERTRLKGGAMAGPKPLFDFGQFMRQKQEEDKNAENSNTEFSPVIEKE